MAEQPAIDPMHQFLVQELIPGPKFEIGGLVFDMSITNSVASMIAGALILVAFFALTAKGQVVPNRGQAMAEALSHGGNRAEPLAVEGGRILLGRQPGGAISKPANSKAGATMQSTQRSIG